jgi:Ca2+-binding EF-hand superfamily protein
MDGDDSDLSDEERADFAKLDSNGDGSIDVQELRAWESAGGTRGSTDPPLANIESTNFWNRSRFAI